MSFIIIIHQSSLDLYFILNYLDSRSSRPPSTRHLLCLNNRMAGRLRNYTTFLLFAGLGVGRKPECERRRSNNRREKENQEGRRERKKERGRERERERERDLDRDGPETQNKTEHRRRRGHGTDLASPRGSPPTAV